MAEITTGQLGITNGPTLTQAIAGQVAAGTLAPAPQPKPLTAMLIPVKELDALGRSTVYEVEFPTSANFAEWSLAQQVAMLKQGAFSKVPVSQIIYAIAYANRLKLDILQGDVYSTGEGRIALSNKAKIRLAQETGRIRSIETTFTKGDPINIPDCPHTNDIICTVTVEVVGFTKPLVKTQRLSEWYMPKNPNWKSRPSHMLELNTLAHACELIHPTDNTDEYNEVQEAPKDALELLSQGSKQ